jgi:hypothetical protein
MLNSIHSFEHPPKILDFEFAMLSGDGILIMFEKKIKQTDV